MTGILQSSIGLMRSRLSRQIVFWIFLSLLVIEGIIFVPSFRQRRQEKLRDLEMISSEVLFSLRVQALEQGSLGSDMLKMLQAQLKPSSVILGATLYGADCLPIDSFGEAPEIACQIVQSDRTARGLSGNRYDIGWARPLLGQEYVLTVRHDATQVQQEMVQYALAIGGLVIIISTFVTMTTILMLERLLINPLLRLRDDLLAAGDAISRDQSPDFYSKSLNRSDELGEVAAAFNQMFQRVHYEIKERKEAEAALQAEQEKMERLLHNVLPGSIVEQLKQETGGMQDYRGSAIASRFEEVTILFADIVDFTGLSANIAPTRLVYLLNDIFSAFDSLAEQLGLEKIKTVGDAYMVVGGLPAPRPDHAEAVMTMALEMLAVISSFEREDGSPFRLRIGINTGPVVAGVIGLKRFSYDLWGDAVNLASRMETHGVADHIQVTEAVYHRLKERYTFKHRGAIPIKGRGSMVTYLYSRRLAAVDPARSTPPA